MTYKIITYGCQMNRSDSERIASVLEEIGYKENKTEKNADLIVINMCSIRQSAVDRVYGKINQILKNNGKSKKTKIIVTGCILPKDRNKLKNKVDFILDIKDLPNWQTILYHIFYGREKYSIVKKTIKAKNYLSIKPKYKSKFSALVPISNGCNNACSYCVVPITRGPLVSRDHKEILEEIKDIVKKGFKEIWLLGQNVNDYSSPTDSSINFSKIIKIINDIPGNFWIRFTSPNPKDFSDEMIETMAKCDKLTPYLNLPVQSGDNEILKRMNRFYSSEDYENLVKKIRSSFRRYRSGLEKEICLSTDIIVGFPGETKKQFENTAKLMKTIKFDMAYIAKYSNRSETVAGKLKNNVSQKEKDRREKFLTNILKKTAQENNKKYVGSTIDVLVNKYKNNFLIGKSFHYKTVKFEGDKNLIGKIVKVKVIDALPWGLEGVIL